MCVYISHPPSFFPVSNPSPAFVYVSGLGLSLSGRFNFLIIYPSLYLLETPSLVFRLV